MAKTKSKKIAAPVYEPQDPTELAAMIDFYGQQYQEVHFVHCLKCNRIIAAECAPAVDNLAHQERNYGDRNIFGYQELFFTSRMRLDTNAGGQRMIGYECRCGNDTRLSEPERGVVPTSTDAVPARNLSPFEQHQLQHNIINVNQAVKGYKADYELYSNADGRTTERFETFEVIRMK